MISLLSRSLIGESMAAARALRRRLADRAGRSPAPTLLAARLQEAEHLLAGQVPPDDRAEQAIARRLGGWAFHR